MSLSGKIEEVLLNGKPIDWGEEKVAGQRYIALSGIKLQEEINEILIIKQSSATTPSE